MGACLQRSVSQGPQRLADALFPVMGPAIRRAIGESLKGLVQSINQAVEHSLSPRGLRCRLEAWRSGSSFAEVVLKHTLVYRVEAAYLIHNDNGLLIDHVVLPAGRRRHPRRDPGMLRRAARRVARLAHGVRGPDSGPIGACTRRLAAPCPSADS